MHTICKFTCKLLKCLYIYPTIQVYMHSVVTICYPNAMKSGVNSLNLRKGAWGSDEDTLLRKCIQKYGQGKWHLVPQRAGLNRCRKSCRLRWLNYLRPTINRGEFGADEVDLMIRLHTLLGNRWPLIGGRLQKSELVEGKQVMSNNIGNTSSAATATNIVIKPLPRTLSKATTLPSYNLMSFGSEETLHDNNKKKPSPPATLPSNDDGIEGLSPNGAGIEWWKNLFADMDIHDQEQDPTEGVLVASSSGVLEDLADGERGLIWKTDESTDPATEANDGWSDIWDLLNSSDDI